MYDKPLKSNTSTLDSIKKDDPKKYYGNLIYV